MTAAFNLSQLANNLNTSGQLDATDGLSGLVANANLASSGTASSSTFLRGDRTWGTPVGGKILQVSQNITSTIQSITGSNAYYEISALASSFTPTLSSSKVYMIWNIMFSATTNAYPAYNIQRNGTNILDMTDSGTGVPTNFGSFVGGGGGIDEYRLHNAVFSFLDSPATTSTLTYRLYVNPMRTSTHTWKLNASITIGDENQFNKTWSTVTFFEVAA